MLWKTAANGGCSREELTTKIHLVTASDRAAVSFSLSSGNASDGPEGRKLLSVTPYNKIHCYLIMDRAYVPVVPPKQNNKLPWEYDKELYK